MVGAVVLSAGASFRMGSPKALLKIGGETFLQHIVGVLRSCGVRDMAIVLGSGAAEIRTSLTWFGGTVVHNERWQQGQLTSILCGLDALLPLGPEGLLICPVDRPLITPLLVRTLLDYFENSKDKIVVPLYRGRRGHPAIFPRKMFDMLRTAPLTVGARHLLRTSPSEVHEVPTEEEGAVVNIDTPSDYRMHILRDFRGSDDES